MISANFDPHRIFKGLQDDSQNVTQPVDLYSATLPCDLNNNSVVQKLKQSVVKRITEYIRRTQSRTFLLERSDDLTEAQFGDYSRKISWSYRTVADTAWTSW